MTKIEREIEIVLGHDDRGGRLQRVPHSKLVNRIGVRSREIGDHDVGIEQVLVHRLVDHRRMDDLVGAHAFEAGVCDCRLDDVLVSLVEIEHALRIGLKVGLLAETHDHEAYLLTVRHG